MSLDDLDSRAVCALPRRRSWHARWSVHTRLGVLFAASALLLAGLLVSVQYSQNRQVQLMFRERVQDTDAILTKLVSMRSNDARSHADDYTRWDEFVDYTRHPDTTWARINIEQNIGTFGLDAAWVLDDRFSLLFSSNPGPSAELARPPLPLADLADHLGRKPIQHFFTRSGDTVLELWTSPIHASADLQRTAAPAGYYIVARRWDDECLTQLSHLAEGRAAVEPYDPARAAATGDERTGEIRITRPLLDEDGVPAASLVFRSYYPVVTRVHDAMWTSQWLLLAGSALLMLIVWYGMSRWISRPMRAISQALQDRDPSGLRATSRRQDEFGHLAQLVEEFFAQREGLIAARVQAEAGTRAKSQFLASISHELRTPMHGILSYSRFGVRDAMTADRAELAENFRQIEECGDSLLALLNDLLDLSKLEAGRMTFEFDEVALDDLVNEAIDQFASYVNECRLTLTIESEPGLRPVIADRMRVLQVLRNLLSNAAKFTPETGALMLRVETVGECARVIVRDTGRGIPDGELKSIFEKFTQASNTDSRVQGTGLGLAICREIVEAHEGRIWARNVPTGGAELVFELPFDGPLAARTPEHDSGAGTRAA